MKLSELRGQKILVLGLGQEGVATINFLLKNGVADFAAADVKSREDLSAEAQEALRKAACPFVGGENYLADLAAFDVVIKSPGVKIPPLQAAKAKKITSATAIFFANCEAKIIGITGSKGKSTTANAIYQLLKAGGKNVVFVGNIGNPMLAVLGQTSDFVVAELSSYQLENLPYSPHIAVLSSFFPEHLDYHGSLESYRDAKMNIFRWQGRGDFAIVPEDFSLPFATEARVITFGDQVGDFFLYQDEKIAPKSSLKLLGEHNIRNATAAIIVAKILDIPNAAIQKGLENIEPLPHRLNFIATKNEVEFWDDAISTNPDSTIAALNCFPERVGTLFLGGSDRDLDFTDLAKGIVKRQIPVLIFFPTNGEKIWNSIKPFLSSQYQPKTFFATGMKDAVRYAAENTEKGKIALFSTASPSFSLWKNYKDQGEQFSAAVHSLL